MPRSSAGCRQRVTITGHARTAARGQSTPTPRPTSQSACPKLPRKDRLESTHESQDKLRTRGLEHPLSEVLVPDLPGPGDTAVLLRASPSFAIPELVQAAWEELVRLQVREGAAERGRRLRGVKTGDRSSKSTPLQRQRLHRQFMRRHPSSATILFADCAVSKGMTVSSHPLRMTITCGN